MDIQIFHHILKKDVEVPGMNGNYSHDSALANYVWHRVEDGKTMQLIPKNIHNKFPHTGVASGLKNGTLP